MSHEMRYVLKLRPSRIVTRRARMPTSRGAKPPPLLNWPPPVKGENEPPPVGGATGAGAGCGVPSEGCCSWVSSVASVEEEVVLGETPARDPKNSVVALDTLAAMLRTVPTALAALVPRLEGRRNAPPTEVGTVGTSAATGDFSNTGGTVGAGCAAVSREITDPTDPGTNPRTGSGSSAAAPWGALWGAIRSEDTGPRNGSVARWSVGIASSVAEPRGQASGEVLGTDDDPESSTGVATGAADPGVE
jgi:hypothetical protein